jgi:hypothetical protein
VYGQKPRVDLLDLPIPLQTLIDLNDEVELNALLGVEDYMGMEDIEEEDELVDEDEDGDYDSDSSNESDVPGVRRSVVVVPAIPTSIIDGPTLPAKPTAPPVQGTYFTICIRLFCNLKFNRYVSFCNLKKTEQ